MEGENNTKKEVSTDDLALIIKEGFEKSENKFSLAIKEGFEKSDKRTDKKIEELALMVAKGFEDVNEKIVSLETGIKEIKDDTENIKADLNKKVDKVTYNTLTYRVEKLEKKFA